MVFISGSPRRRTSVSVRVPWFLLLIYWPVLVTWLAAVWAVQLTVLAVRLLWWAGVAVWSAVRAWRIRRRLTF